MTIIRDGELDNLKPDDLARLSAGTCPRCGDRGFVIGPAGGAALNIECANLSCRARFNVVFRSGEALMGHVNPREKDGGGRWPSQPSQRKRSGTTMSGGRGG
jgi:hypothetical protein